MKVLVLNCGSSSVKFKLIETDEALASRDEDRTLASGVVESIGGPALMRYEAVGQAPVRETAEILEHKVAVERILGLLAGGDSPVAAQREIGAVGHRVVHGGERFSQSALIDDEVLTAIEECFALAPLHNPPNVKGYRAARALLPETPQVAVFDTSFHQTMAPWAYLYAIPYVLYERHGIRRYGFHGTSHRFVSERAARRLDRVGDAELRLVTAHLGNGCSVAAIRGGRSVDTSMGFTPLEGLVMGTRSGDLDPAILGHVAAREELGPVEISALLNKHSGLLGLSGLSGDMRRLLQAEAEGHERARLAIESFCHRLRKYVASYAAVLGGVDGLVFTGGIGENAASIRERTGRGLEAVGLSIDAAKNASVVGEAEITGEGSKGRVFVIPTNEELLIARDSERIVEGRAAA
jgi:acetate kinase